MFKVKVIPVLSDNYIFLINTDSFTAVVDPAEADPVLDVLDKEGLKLTHILNTHHHADHVGGNLTLKEKTGCKIIGSKADEHRTPGMDESVSHGDTISLGKYKADVFFTPGHTSGHIAFFFKNEKALFCGDTLFSLGCGRLFEGTPAQMWKSMKILRALPDDTTVYCTHEYTQANAKFALTIDPKNSDLLARSQEIDGLRAKNIFTVPTNLGVEKKTNPFLRADVLELQKAMGREGQDPTQVFAEIRSRKDDF